MSPTFIKTAWHSASAAVMQNAPAIAAGLAIVAGAVALYKGIKQGAIVKEKLEEAKEAKRQAEIKELLEGLEKSEVKVSDEEKEQRVKQVKDKEMKLEVKETAKILAMTLWKPAIWGFTAALCVVASVVFGQRQIKAATAIAAGGAAAMSDRVAAELATIGKKKTDETNEKMYTKRAENALRAITDEHTQIVRTGRGEELFVEPVFTGQVFYSSVYSIRESVVRLNERLQAGERLSVNDYLDELGLPSPKHYNGTGFLYEPAVPNLSDHLTVEFYGSQELITMPSGAIKSAIAAVLCNDPHEAYDEL